MATGTRPFRRSAMIAALRDATEPFDVVVIGGGITGAGVALDAAARGLRTVLIERDDFASGTSSKSSKMVHGGLRYLQQGDVRLVHEALRERRRVMRNAAHLVEILPFMIPILTRDGVVSRKIAKALGPTMWMYDLAGGWRIGKLHRSIGAAEAAAHFPTAHLDALSAAFVYYDAGADDARLTLAIARSAADRGAVVVNRCPARAVTHDTAGRADGVVIDADGDEITVRARCVVNAGGVWADDIRSLDETAHPDSIRPAKGVHIVLPWALVRNDIAVIIPVRADKRSLFIVPWGPLPDGRFAHVYVGTTDTDDDGPLDDPRCTDDDIDYVLAALNEALTVTVTPDDITGVWAGLRPLVKSVSPDRSAKTADLSRRHLVEVSDSGVVRVTGGKLTTYREMAEDAVDVVTRQLGERRAAWRSPTRRLRLHGAPSSTAGLHRDHLGRRYGTDAAEIRSLIAQRPDLAEPLVPGQPYLRAEAIYAVRSEMATTLDDVLTRRTRAHLFARDAARDAAADVAALIAPELGWDGAEIARQIASYHDRCDADTPGGTRDHVTDTTD